MTLLDKTNTLVIVPAYNEQDSIVSVIEEIKTTGFPVVVIDDGSTDETRNRAITAGARTISLPFNSGVGGALKCGFMFALSNGYLSVIQCDADGQHNALAIEELMYEANQCNSAMVIGSRYKCLSESSNYKNTGSRLFASKKLAKIASRHCGCAITDSTSGFRVIRKPLLNEFAERFPRYYLGDTFEALVTAGRSGYAISEIKVEMFQRKTGRSSATSLEAISKIFKVLAVTLVWQIFQTQKKKI